MQDQSDDKQKKEPMPADSIQVVVGPNQYTIKRPNVGQIIDIEKMKLRLSGGQHTQMLYGDLQAQQAFAFTEMVATFTILLPDLQKHLLVGSLLELEQQQAGQLVQVYEKTVFPWLSALRKAASEG